MPRAVRRGVKYALLVGDMPFMTYKYRRKRDCSERRAVHKKRRVRGRKDRRRRGDVRHGENPGQGRDTRSRAYRPYAPDAAQLGGFRVQGKDAKGAAKLIDSAMALEKAGCFAIVLECVPDMLAKLITEKIGIPTIGIGAGPYCDGQVIVTNDMIGLYDKFTPKFVKKYADLWPQMLNAFKRYKDDVESGNFPAQEHSFAMNGSELKKIKSVRRTK
jgi:3-methyl-2-oxobutanoate hydroxymethyltransferase